MVYDAKKGQAAPTNLLCCHSVGGQNVQLQFQSDYYLGDNGIPFRRSSCSSLPREFLEGNKPTITEKVEDYENLEEDEQAWTANEGAEAEDQFALELDAFFKWEEEQSYPEKDNETDETCSVASHDTEYDWDDENDEGSLEFDEFHMWEDQQSWSTIKSVDTTAQSAASHDSDHHSLWSSTPDSGESWATSNESSVRLAARISTDDTGIPKSITVDESDTTETERPNRRNSLTSKPWKSLCDSVTKGCVGNLIIATPDLESEEEWLDQQIRMETYEL